MSRNMTAAMQSGIAASIVRPVFFFEAQFLVTQYFWSHFGDISWNGHTWTGIGNLISIGTIEETAELRSSGLALTLSGIDRTFCETVRDDLKSGNLGKLYLGLLDSDGGLIDSPRIIFRGKLDTAEISYRDPTKPVINFQYETAMIDLERSRNWRLTDAHQQFRYPGDTGLRHVESLQDKQFKWFSV